MFIGGFPIVSLDKVYLECDEPYIIFLDCTRLNNSDLLVSRSNPNNSSSVDESIKSISDNLKNNNLTNIVLADDVVFSGKVLKTIISKFRSNGINVLGIRSCISMRESYDYFNNTLPLGLKCGCVMEDEVIDQICERDFYFGVPQSGISVSMGNKVYKAPYFEPFGDPVERASIPMKYKDYFSKGCLIRSLALWNRIEKLSNKNILISDLPENIINTNNNDRVVKVLKKQLTIDRGER